MLTVGISLGVLALFLLGIFQKSRRGRCNSDVDLSGKTVLVTGANGGIGFHTVMDLATRNARVIMACRNLKRGEKALNLIKKETGNTKLVLHELDVSSLKSVRTFGSHIVACEEKIDILINNAGVTGLPFTKTSDGLETMFATNHFGPFLLTNLLLDKVKAAEKGRIIFVSSIIHKWGNMDVDNMNCEKYFNPSKIYFNSKMANVMTANELARTLEGSGVTVNSLHPGSIRTDLLQHLAFPIRMLLFAIGYFYFRTPEEGAQCTIHCAVSEAVEGVTGKYFEECKVAKECAQARDSGLCRKVWERTERLVGL